MVRPGRHGVVSCTAARHRCARRRMWKPRRDSHAGGLELGRWRRHARDGFPRREAQVLCSGLRLCLSRGHGGSCRQLELNPNGFHERGNTVQENVLKRVLVTPMREGRDAHDDAL
ncbi:hypothetical protein VFPFJ_02143 [Purpureocillium lilacinum]|uniref:Uncharacterized protein n=1 Tax=Purpureocillium lilacinum TaxID=33203 RepID=A0A179HSY6_PURLI|nr:hypothetical protein VFPFJ_02143 [Purpureocillium lilacinum]OAQ79261.1 hypothetical protein VFPBJ_07382 [Purpureocillium lilacinum]OAQ92982.1 hypothetical protein VFPFJ_02143 [Purpureocillium lilacinum]